MTPLTSRPEEGGEACCIAQGINVALLRQVAERIKAHPKAFDMIYYFSQSTAAGVASIDEAGSALPDLLAEECGSTACIAGWSVALGQDEFMPFIGNTWVRGKRLLGLDADQATRLFHYENWPPPFGNEYEDAWENENTDAMAEVAARRIEHFIQSGASE